MYIIDDILYQFLQRVSIPCYVECCILLDSVRPYVCLSHAGIMSKKLQL